jgi:hypothetical protein
MRGTNIKLQNTVAICSPFGLKNPYKLRSQYMKLRFKYINGIRGTTGAQNMMFNKYNINTLQPVAI